MKISPKTRRNISRVLPFGAIWLLTGCVFVLIETAAMGTALPNSPTIINLTLPVFFFAMISVTIVGLIIGLVEVVLLENVFRKKSFPQKVFYKFVLYSFLIILIVAITYPIAASFESNLSILDVKVWQKFGNYLQSITFLSTLLQISFSLFLSLLYAAISENLGHAVLANFFTGKYHKPKQEHRIFMFLDMKSSTTIAEQLGHIQYFELLREYYLDFSDAIINHGGEVYQYIGDEIVVTWKAKQGLQKGNCVHCFFAMKADLQKRSAFYQKRFGMVPSFKAGLHLGNVTTGEIGALKKEIFYTGDVLNATARIQSLCKEYQLDLLISGELMTQLSSLHGLKGAFLGRVNLKGRVQPMDVFTIEQTA